MNLTQNGPAGAPGHDLKTTISDKGFYNALPYFTQAQNAPCCFNCAFYELIDRPRRHYPLCHFTGEKYPLPERDGCSFLAGRWSQIDQILGLTDRDSAHSLDFPNLVRPCDSLVCSQDRQKIAQNTTAIHAYTDKSGIKALHIGRAPQRPHVRETAAASLRPGSVVSCPAFFAFNNPELSEVYENVEQL